MNPNLYNMGTGINPNGGNLNWSLIPAIIDVNLSNNSINNLTDINFSDSSTYTGTIGAINNNLFLVNQEINAIKTIKSALYYKSSFQNFPSGTSDITFDLSRNWNNSTYIAKTSANIFEVLVKGIYQLNLNVAVNPTSATWTNFSKIIQIDIQRGSESSLTSQYGFAPSGTFWALSTSSLYELDVGDLISCEVVSNHTGNCHIAGESSSNFDLNTYFSWTLINEL
jgi:hypothetical protein